MSLLEAARDRAAPDWVVGGGVIRSAVWDRLHGYATPTPPRDIDVAFFDPDDLRPEREQAFRAQLLARHPEAPWEAKNQAAVHLWYQRRFGLSVTPLVSTEDALGAWTETATCVGVRLQPDGELLVLAPLGLDDLFEMIWRRNPRRCTLDLFYQRLREKRILEQWPKVRVIEP